MWQCQRAKASRIDRCQDAHQDVGYLAFRVYISTQVAWNNAPSHQVQALRLTFPSGCVRQAWLVHAWLPGVLVLRGQEPHPSSDRISFLMPESEPATIMFTHYIEAKSKPR